ncbi:MAG: 6-phosphofructokinase, partial [Candidatus Omnitrophota bacterium]
MVKYSSLVMPCVMPGAVLLIALFASVDPVICGNELVMCQQDVNSLRQMSRVERDNFPNPEHMDREHRAAISLSGGEAPGVNAYDAFLAAELAARGISLEALQYGLDTFDAKDDADFAKGLLWIDRDRADRTGLMPGADTGTSRVNIDEKNEPLLEAKLRRLSKRCKYLFQKGGNDHLDQARKLGEFCKKHDIDLVVIGLPKTIDYDTKGVYPIGSRTAGEEMHDMVRRAAAPVGSGKCSIVQVMGRDMGMLAALAADDDPTYLVALPEWGADLTKLRAAVRNRMKKYGACTLILSEGFKIAGNDPVFKEVLDSERGAFLKYKYETISTKVDAHLNTLVTELGIADFIAEALAMDAQMSLVRDRNLTIQDGGYAIRDVTPN